MVVCFDGLRVAPPCMLRHHANMGCNVVSYRRAMQGVWCAQASATACIACVHARCKHLCVSGMVWVGARPANPSSVGTTVPCIRAWEVVAHRGLTYSVSSHKLDMDTVVVRCPPKVSCSTVALCMCIHVWCRCQCGHDAPTNTALARMLSSYEVCMYVCMIARPGWCACWQHVCD